ETLILSVDALQILQDRRVVLEDPRHSLESQSLTHLCRRERFGPPFFKKLCPFPGDVEVQDVEVIGQGLCNQAAPGLSKGFGDCTQLPVQRSRNHDVPPHALHCSTLNTSIHTKFHTHKPPSRYDQGEPRASHFHLRHVPQVQIRWTSSRASMVLQGFPEGEGAGGSNRARKRPWLHRSSFPGFCRACGIDHPFHGKGAREGQDGTGGRAARGAEQ